MFFRSIILYVIIIPTIVYSQCYSGPSETWTCDRTYKSNNLSYEKILNDEKLKKFYLTNFELSTFKIDNYPLTLELFNASRNKFKSLIITGKNRFQSNLKYLILDSNHLKTLPIDKIVLPNSLKKISLAFNQLEILDARIFSHLKDLIEIDLSNNRLKRILPDLILNRNVKLDFNPLDCRCTTGPYKTLCRNATSITSRDNGNKKCSAPYYNPRAFDSPLPLYLRFSTFTLYCPISGSPPPIIIWSTPFGNLTSMNSTNVDLLSSDNYEDPIYVTISASAGPLTARTQHTLHAFNESHLSVSHARAALQHRISCSGVNMLGVYTYEFNFDIETYATHRALWQILYTMAFGIFLSLIGGALCVILKRTHYNTDNLKTPPIYPTMAPNSAARTPPNFELNQWLSIAAANISETLEQVRDKLRLGVQQVSEHMGQTMGRATELFTYGVQHAGGTIRQAAETSAAYLHSFRESSQQRLNTMRVQTLSSLRNPGSLMRAGMNMLTTQVNSLRDYCGVMTGNPLPANYLMQQRQQLHNLQYSPAPISYLHHNRITTIHEDDESNIESTSLIDSTNPIPYVGHTTTIVSANTSGIGQLDAANSSALLTLENFTQTTSTNTPDHENIVARGQMSAGIGTFHGHMNDQDDLINEPERLIMYGHQRPNC